VGAEPLGALEPLARAGTLLRELPVPPLLEPAVATLEREHLLVPDRGEALPGVGGRADLHPVGVPEVVDDVDARRWELAVRMLAVGPLADRARPAVHAADAEPGAAQPARRRQRIGDAEAHAVHLRGEPEVLGAERDQLGQLRRVDAAGDRARRRLGGCREDAPS
jgi:hypothetical protein